MRGHLLGYDGRSATSTSFSGSYGGGLLFEDKPLWYIDVVSRGLMQQREVVFNAYKGTRLGDLSEEENTEAYYRVIVSRYLRTKITDQLFTP